MSKQTPHLKPPTPKRTATEDPPLNGQQNNYFVGIGVGVGAMVNPPLLAQDLALSLDVAPRKNSKKP